MRSDDTDTESDAGRDHTVAETVLDKAAIEQDIEAGAKAFRELLKNADLDWTHWSATILGMRGLRALAYERARTTNMRSQAFRDAISGLLTLRKYSIYDQIDRQARSDCYRLMDQLEAIDVWYGGLDRADKMRWKHPSTIAKHVPRHLLTGGMRKHNQPKKAGKKPLAVSAETERLKQLLIQVIKRLAKHEPDALDLLDQIHPADPEDDVDDLFTAENESES